MKPLGQDGYFVRPFKAYKSHLYSYTFPSASDSEYKVNIDEAYRPPVGWRVEALADEPINPDGVYKRQLWASVNANFYTTHSVSGSVLQNDQSRLYDLADTFYVINISQQAYGEAVRPTSVRLTAVGTANIIVDDGLGRLINTGSGDIVGNIFYGLGIGVVNKGVGAVIDTDGFNLTTGSVVNIGFDSTVTIYEHNAICTLERGELNYSTNPSLNLVTSSSVSQSARLFDLIASGTLTPYITTVGLFNSVGELLAIGKLPTAIKRTPEMEQTFVVRFDI